MSTSVSPNSNNPPPPNNNNSQPPPGTVNKSAIAPSNEETELFNSIISEPSEYPPNISDGVYEQPPTENAQENNSQQDNQEVTESVQANTVPQDNQRNVNEQNDQNFSDNVQNNSSQQNNQDNPQKVQGNSNQQNNQGNSSGGGGGGSSSGQNTPVTSEQLMAELGMSILSSMGAMSTQDPTGESEPSDARGTISTLGQELIDKFYTSSSGDKAIYLELKVMDGAKVMLTREDGALNIQFDANTNDSASTLNNMSNGLADYMQKRLGLTVNVKVNNLASGDQTGGDGRSRQQRSVIDEYKPGSRA